MVHSLATATPISTRCKTQPQFPSVGFQSVRASHHAPPQTLDIRLINRRSATLGLGSAMVGLKVGERSADAAAKRPPPPPPGEKKDPNVSGVQAKVLASKKRKEAMKEAIAKLREKGKAVVEPSE